MVHNNYIIGADSKIYREKEMLFYKVDIDQYYSSINNNYFTFIYNHSSHIYDIENLILAGLSYTNLSNFIFILPRVLCVYCKIINKIWCSYIDCWKIRYLDYCFNKKYRENVYVILYCSSLL